MILSLPFVVLTLGLFIFVINAFLLYLVGQMKGFHVEGFWAAFFGALVISLVSLLVNWLIGPKQTPPQGPPPQRPRGDDSGPVIDV
jgi:putative membrane protein